MFDKIFPWAFFFNWMPYPRRFSFLGFGFVFWYSSYYKKYEDAAIAYHRSCLYELDPAFRIGEAGLEVVRRREEAIEQGIGPLDPEYPPQSAGCPCRGIATKAKVARVAFVLLEDKSFVHMHHVGRR